MRGEIERRDGSGEALVEESFPTIGQQLIAAVEERRAEFRRAVAWLQESGRLLTHAETATLKNRLEIVIRGERAGQSAPLPVVLENDRTVAVRAALPQPLD